MSDPKPPTLKPYIVVLSFGEGGPLYANALLAPNAESAMAMFSVMTMREFSPPQLLVGCMTVELQPDFLRAALRAVEGKLPPGGEAQIVSLVPQAPPQGSPLFGPTPEALEQRPSDEPPPAA